MPKILPGPQLSGGISGAVHLFQILLCFVLKNRDREEDKALLSKEHLVMGPTSHIWSILRSSVLGS